MSEEKEEGFNICAYLYQHAKIVRGLCEDAECGVNIRSNGDEVWAEIECPTFNETVKLRLPKQPHE